MNDITVIIPFLNEGVEVYNTLKNIRHYSSNNVDILLINDCSTDSVNYKEYASKFNAKYIEHVSRCGVASSRDEAINLIETKYFILLDAHMRVYSSSWYLEIIQELKKNDRAIYCGITLMLDDKGNLMEDKVKGYGAYLRSDFTPGWITEDLNPDMNIVDIPCVYGASYAGSKRYWTYLGGLKGLKSYGVDEQLISIKAWLEGGKCRLLKKVSFGHIFRGSNNVPYQINSFEFLYNVLYTMELIGAIKKNPELLKSLAQNYSREHFNNAMEVLLKEKEEISKEKNNCKSIFSHKYDFFHNLNDDIIKIIKVPKAPV